MSVASALDARGRAAVRGVGQADLMVGIPSFGNADTIGYVVRAAMAGMVQYFTELKPVLVNADGGSPDDTTIAYTVGETGELSTPCSRTRG